MTVREMRARLVGRRIVGFEARAFRDGRRTQAPRDRSDWEPPPNGGGFTYDPVLILDDGTRLAFNVHETEGSEYGIDPIISAPRKGNSE